MTLIFKRPLIEKIRRLEKTATRRVSKPNVKEEGIYRLRVDYRGSLTDRISVKRLHTQSLGSMTQEDVRKEGFKSKEEFMDNWVELYGSWDREHIAWVVEFEYLGTGLDEF